MRTAAGLQRGTITIRPTESSQAGIRYAVQSLRGSRARLTFVVTWQETTERRRRVHLMGEKYIVGRQSLVWTSAPHRTAPTMRTYRSFADTLRRELTNPSTLPTEATSSPGDVPPTKAE